MIEARNDVGGYCATKIDPETAVMTHCHGPHIFHTADLATWAFIRQFGAFMPYRHRVAASLRGQVFPLPITLATINQFFGQNFTSETARRFIAAQCIPISNPQNFEEAALSQIGPALYQAFFKPYTEKQWGRPARALPKDIVRLSRRCWLLMRGSLPGSGSPFRHQRTGAPPDRRRWGRRRPGC